MAKHEKSFVGYDKSYETNLIGMKGIIYFGVGLLLLIVVTFGLMYFLVNVMEDESEQSKDAKVNQLRRDAVEKNPDAFLPPEPRLQAAPGFGVDSENGRVDLELKAPQSEYRELHKQWEKQWADGQKDAKTGTIVTLPIEEAKKKLLEENVKAVAGDQAQKNLDEARSIVSYSSAGRVAAEKRIFVRNNK